MDISPQLPVGRGVPADGGFLVLLQIYYQFRFTPGDVQSSYDLINGNTFSRQRQHLMAPLQWNP